ncbi:enoyl-CoA hydratase/isomerase family protein [Flexithrix dorotheae]|uniref:enoyl-CoA hydratase/isomerase family protein n=1 Tax=Flexithrix dorotheae TaxID=70993 RepID=UPI00035F5E2D|nr:enoyl-CoA hydratase/isomerase family protein [Flexithrix dorotheae]
MDKSNFKFIEYTVKERIIYITLNRPEKRNALNPQLVNELKSAFSHAKNENQGKVVILKANGKVFCSGADLAYIQKLQNNSYEENLEDSHNLMELFQQIYTLPKVVIAQVHGHAIAGGCGLATVCDFVFAVPEAKFGYTEVKIGFIPAIVSFFLLRKLGEGITKELLLTGDLILAPKAKQYHLINDIVENPDLEKYVAEFAKRLIETNSEQSMALTKLLINDIQVLDTQKAMELAASQNASSRSTTDCKKGISAFLNKEPLKW